ncbi:MAG TPA: LuxR family transcriptional regulator [Sphingomicrobium sp.]|nr:LuxR family transcriptional regulator [Sphingomicrobium sp.]
MFDRVDRFIKDVRELGSEEHLGEALNAVTFDLGCRYYALTHHVDALQSSGAVRIHNYPDRWAEWFDAQSLGTSDPVRRASSLTSIGFSWSRLPDLINLTARDRHILELAVKQGIGEGFTVPAHVPGEAQGSCSFACASGESFPEHHVPLLQLAGEFAFEAARRLRRPAPQEPVRLTDRQRECVIWTARGKSDWEIAMILGISEETVAEHLRHARERYGVGKRTLVAIHALFDGHIGFLDVLRR